jgi:poly(3-hydroxybutyrate) depolymerase
MKLVQLLAAVVVAGAVRPSPGCGRRIEFRKGERTLYTFTVDDPQGLGSIEREFTVVIPDSATPDVPQPLWFYFHGQSGNGFNAANSATRARLGREHRFTSVYPQGLSDSEGISFCGTGWNTGANGDADTCTSAADLFSCCYKSCRQLGKCTGNFAEAKCGWSTCYDDTHMTAALLEHIGDRMCVDLDQVLITGASNGGMVAFTIAAAIPDKIKFVVPIFGLPLVGHLNVPDQLVNVPYLFLSGRQDRVVPIDGTESDQGWFYVTAAEAARAYAEVHGCDLTPQLLKTPFDGGNKNFECTEHPNCKSLGKVVTCLYDGGHVTPGGSVAEDITWWFVDQVTKADRGNTTQLQRIASED